MSADFGRGAGEGSWWRRFLAEGTVTVGAISAHRRYSWALTTPLATLALSLLLNAITSRTLAPEGFGQFAVMIGVMTLLGALVGLGMPVTLARFVAGTSNPTERDRYCMAAWLLVLGAGGVMLAALVLLDAVSPGLLDQWIVPGTAFAVGAGAIGMALVDLAAAESQGEGAFHGYFARLVGGSAARVLGVVIALSALGATAGSAVVGYAVASLLLGGILAARSIHHGRQRRTVGIDDVRATIVRIARFGLPVLGSSVVIATIVYVDTLIVASTLPDREVGWYAAAGRLTIAQSTVIGGLAALALPLATRAVAEGRDASFISFALRFPGVIGVAVTVALVGLSGLIVRIVYGSSFQPAAAIFVILSLGLLPNFFGNAVSQLLYARGKPGYLLWVHLGQLTALVALLPGIAMRFGIGGVAAWRSAVNVIAVGFVIWMAVRWRGPAAPPSSLDTFVPPPLARSP